MSIDRDDEYLVTWTAREHDAGNGYAGATDLPAAEHQALQAIHLGCADVTIWRRVGEALPAVKVVPFAERDITT